MIRAITTKLPTRIGAGGAVTRRRSFGSPSLSCFFIWLQLRYAGCGPDQQPEAGPARVQI